MALVFALAPPLAIFSGTALALTPAGTVIRSVASVTCKLEGTRFSFQSNPAGVDVGGISLLAVEPPQGSAFIKPGRSAKLSHRITNNGNAPDCFELEAGAGGWLAVGILAADGVTSLPDSNGDGRPDTGVLASGAGIDILVQLTVQESAQPGSQAEAAVKAVSRADPTVSATILETATVANPNFWKYVLKSVSPPGQITQGSLLTYSITFGIDESAPATEITISDPLDPRLEYQEGSATLPQGVEASFSYDPSSRAVLWRIPAAPAGYTGALSFQARVDPETGSDTTIENSTRIVSAEEPEARLSNAVRTPVIEQPLRVTVSAGRGEVEIGEFVAYTVTVENISRTLQAEAVRLHDTLPRGLRYAEKSSRLEGLSHPDPAGAAAPTWEIGPVGPGEKKVLLFRAIVTPSAPTGDAVNSVRATGTSPAGNSLASPEASVKVKVAEGALNSRATVLGRVFIDLNRDLMPDTDEPGVQGARLYLEDGSFVVTDQLGKFSFFGVRAGEHVLKLDPASLPVELKPQPLDSSFAGDGRSRFVIAPFGGMGRGDFGLWQQETGSGTIPEPAGSGAAGGAPPILPAAPSGAESSTGDAAPQRSYTFSAATPATPPSLEESIGEMPQSAAILDPPPGSVLRRRWSDIVIRVPDRDQYILKLNGTPLSDRRIGKKIWESQLKIAIYRYVGVKLEPGSNLIELELTHPDGSTELRQGWLFAPGDAVKVRIAPDKSDIPADAKTQIPFTVSFLDRDGRLTSQEITYTVFTAKGEVVEPDLDTKAPGHQLKAADGRGVFHLRSTLKTGAERLSISAGTGLDGSSELYFTPELREWIVVGIGSLTAGSNSGDAMVQLSDEERPGEGIYQEGKLAFFAKGKVLGKYLLTAAYDSDKEERSELFQRVEPDRYYPIYGDASLKGYEAESQEKYYLKIEKERSQLLVGDFHTELAFTEFSRYQRSFNGVKADIDGDNVALRAFGSSTSHSSNRDELQGNGTSGYYFLRRKPIVENSEKVRIEVRDRYRPEQIISAGEKSPYLDYSLDYRNGSLLFREPVPSHDANLNPVRIVVLYESDDPGDENYVYGGRGGIRFEKGSQFGATAVVEETGTRNNTIYGVDGVLALGGETTVAAEAAVTDTEQNGRGTAWKTELHSRFAKSSVDGYYRRVSRDFHNISMTGNEIGSEKYGAKASYSLLDGTTLAANGYVHEDSLNRTRLVSSTLGVAQQFKKGTLDAGYRFVEGPGDSGTGENSAHMAYAGASGQLTSDLEGSLLQEIASTSRTVKDYPSRTVLKLNYRLDDRTSAFLTEEYRESGSARGSNTLLGITSRLRENLTLTTSYQESTGIDRKKEFGTEANGNWALRKDLSVSSRTGYQIQESMSGNRGQALLGLGTSWEALPGVRLGARGERVHLVSGSADPSGVNTALALSAEYLEREDIKGSARYEWRRSSGEIAHLASLGGAFRVNRDLSLLGKGTLWSSRRPAGDDLLFDTQLGLAYRPPGRNSLYLLGLLRLKEESRKGNAEPEGVRTWVSSLELSERLRKHLTLHGKYAGKLVWDTLEGERLRGYSDLALAGAAYDITDRWDFDLSARLTNQYDTGISTLSFVPQTGYRVVKNARLSVGYSFSRLNDSDLSGEGFSGGGPFVQFRFKFDEVSLEELYAGLSPRKKEATLPPQAPAPRPKPPPEPETALLTARLASEPLMLQGSAEALRLLVNDREANLPTADVRIAASSDEMVELAGGPPHPPLEFRLFAAPAESVTSWSLVLESSQGEPVHRVEGEGAPPLLVAWDSDRKAGDPLRGGETYRYRLETRYADGSVGQSPYRLFGLNRSSAVSLSLTGSAFQSGSAVLSRKAKEALRRTALLLRKHQNEKVVVDGHTDRVGSDEANMELSRRRSQAAAGYLVESEGIAQERIVTRWFGESRPIASNDIPEGRELNRRVEVKGEFVDSRRAEINDQHRQPPFAAVNGTPAAVDGLGRFTALVSAESERLEIEMGNGNGRYLKSSLPLPTLKLAEPASGVRLLYPASSHRFAGSTAAGNLLSVDGKKVPVAPDGSFSFDLDLAEGESVHWLQLRNPQGNCREFKLTLSLTRDKSERTAAP